MKTSSSVLCAAALAAMVGCGGAGGGARTDVAAPGGGVIEGSVVGAGAEALTVAVPGGPSTTTDASGAFLLGDVPAGASSLRLTGGGVDASLSIAAVLAGEYRQVTIAVSSTSASERCERTGTEFHGPIEAVDAANRTITVAGRTVGFTDATVVRDGKDAAAFEDLQVGQVVEVLGALQADGTVAALLVVVRPDPGPGDAPGALVFVGTLEAVSGTTLTVSGQAVEASAARVVKGMQELAVADLAVGDHLLVRGVLKDGVVLAGLVRVLGRPGVPDVFHVTGKVTAVDAAGGTFTVGDTKVAVDGDTAWEGHGDPSLATLVVGDFVDAEVKRLDDGSLLAKEVRVMTAPAPGPGDLVALHGTVTEVGADSLTLAVQAGPASATTQVKLLVTAGTRILRGITPIALGDVQVGERAGALASRAADGTLTAIAVEVAPAPPPGVIGMHGTVKAVGTDSVTLTVVTTMLATTNAAGADVTLLVNAGTRILRGATAIGLADLVVGEPVAASAQKAADGTLTALTILVAPAVPAPPVNVHGAIGTVDPAAGTVVVGDRTLHVDDATVILQGVKPIGLADLVTGEPAEAVAVDQGGVLVAKFLWVMPMRS